MLTAEKPSLWRRSYDISADGRYLARWEPSWWRSGGVFDLDGQQYQIRDNALGSRFQLIGPAGQPLASAQRVGRKRWTVQADNRTYQFRRDSIWRGDQELLLGDQAVGAIRRPSMWRGSAIADLPGMPQPVQVFVLCVVLAMWEAAAVAANSAATGRVVSGA
jgi:hypothetical protein